jgi:hypothetical protein
MPNPALSNKLLHGLPREDFELLVSHLVPLQLAQNTVLLEAGEEVAEVYFPLSGMVSMVVVMRAARLSRPRPSAAKVLLARWQGLACPSQGCVPSHKSRC